MFCSFNDKNLNYTSNQHDCNHLFGLVESFDGVKHIKSPSQIKLPLPDACIGFRRKFDSVNRYEADDEAQVLMD